MGLSKLDDFLADWKRVSEAATPRPWQTRFLYRQIRAARSYEGLHHQTDADNDWHDADFTAHARNNGDQLVRMVEAAAERLKADCMCGGNQPHFKCIYCEQLAELDRIASEANSWPQP